MAKVSIATFVWTIKNFDMSPCIPEEEICSPEFNAGSYRFYLVLYPRGCDINEKKTYISLFLRRIDEYDAGKLFVCFENCILNNKRQSTYSMKSEHSFNGKCTFGQKSFIERDTLLISERHSLLPDNALTIKCEIFEIREIQGDSKFVDDREIKILSDNFAEILKSGIYADMAIIVEGIIFTVHKLILENRCPELFNYLVRGDNNYEYSLDNIEAPVFQAILQYLYSGCFNLRMLKKEILDACKEYKIFGLEHALKSLYFKSCDAITEIPVSILSFRWVISEVSKLQINEELVYPAYCISENIWNDEIKISLIKTKSDSSALKLKFKKMKNCKVTFIRFSITFSAGTSRIIKGFEHVFIGVEWIKPLEAGFCQFVYNDSLDMIFTISMSSSETKSKFERVFVTSTKTDSYTIEKQDAYSIENLKLLHKDFRCLHDNMKLPDVTLNVGGETKYAHKVFLCGRSPVFAKMFENDYLEKKEGVITIIDIDSKIVSKLLLYMYCGYFDNLNSSDAIKLYVAADKYAVLTLKDRCSSLLKNAIDVNNVDEILLLAETYQDEILKKCANFFIASKYNRTPQEEAFLQTRSYINEIQMSGRMLRFA